MTSGKMRIGALGGLALSLLLIIGCTRDAASEPVPANPTAGAQAAGAETATPSDFPPAAGTQAVVNPSPAPTSTPLPQVADTPPPTAIPAPTQVAAIATPAPTQLPAGAVTTYTVQAGDRLFSIGRKFGVNPYSIAQANNIVPPYIIHPGRVLNIPGGGTVTPVPGGRTHLVAPGENLFRISLRYGTTVQALAAANKTITNVNLIFVGQVLQIP